MLSLPTRRTFETLGMMMIGDGVLAMIEPRRHVALWRTGPPSWSRALRYFEERPALTAALGLVEVGLGLWLARGQSPQTPRG
ncbi:MAG: hypothetical protein ACK4YQ_07900 [Phenylobacterium sp.]|uniref:hypothetical protein n=1 Tax=Phenylobacterium sp. TaxID=1871053 RepID=UPI00391A7846